MNASNPNTSPSLTVQRTNEKILADTNAHAVVVTDGGVILFDKRGDVVINSPQETGITIKTHAAP
jgi:hypothetical protein